MKKIVLTICAVALSFVGMAQYWAPIHGNGFVTTDINGNEINVADTLAAGKCVLVDYSATWCGPCWNLHNSGILEAIQANLGDQICVLWVECESRNTTAQIYGPQGGSTYADLTYGDWTLTADGEPVPYPVIDCYECESMIDPTGYIPAVYFVSPTGYFCQVYSESYGFDAQTTHAVAVQKMTNLINSYPRSGIAPIVQAINMPASGQMGATISFAVDFISVEDASVAWTFEGGNPASANTVEATSSWNTTGTFNVTVSVTNANGTTTKNGTITINNFTYFFDFSSPDQLEGWTVIDADGDNYAWDIMGFEGHDGNAGVLSSASYINNVGALTPDNWVFTPALTLPNDDNVKVSWWEKGQDASYAAEKYAVYVATSPDIASATKLKDYTATGSWKHHAIKLSEYKGQTVYIAFRHYNVTDMFYLDIDEFGITTDEMPAGINDVADVNFSIYPNPASDKLTVNAEGLREVSILDVAGRTVATSATNVVDLTSLSAGVYMVRVVTANGTASQKFVKE
jgi:hypothetical protein